jgi:hypothetical protein
VIVLVPSAFVVVTVPSEPMVELAGPVGVVPLSLFGEAETGVLLAAMLPSLEGPFPVFAIVVVVPSGLVIVREPSAQFSVIVPSGVDEAELMGTPSAVLVPGGNVVVELPSGLVIVREPSAQFSVIVPSGVDEAELMGTPSAVLVPGGNVVVELPSGLVTVREPSPQF